MWLQSWCPTFRSNEIPILLSDLSEAGQLEASAALEVLLL
jgi:hypothetical protein